MEPSGRGGGESSGSRWRPGDESNVDVLNHIMHHRVCAVFPIQTSSEKKPTFFPCDPLSFLPSCFFLLLHQVVYGTEEAFLPICVTCLRGRWRGTDRSMPPSSFLLFPQRSRQTRPPPSPSPVGRKKILSGQPCTYIGAVQTERRYRRPFSIALAMSLSTAQDATTARCFFLFLLRCCRRPPPTFSPPKGVSEARDPDLERQERGKAAPESWGNSDGRRRR